MTNDKKMIVKVTQIEAVNTVRVNANGDIIERDKHKLKCVSRDGGTVISFSTPEEWNGYKENQVLDVIVTTSQMALNDFDDTEAKEVDGAE